MSSNEIHLELLRQRYHKLASGSIHAIYCVLLESTFRIYSGMFAMNLK